MKVKVCGMKFRDNLNAVAALRPDMLGFIFYEKSPRYMADYLTPEDLGSLPVEIEKVGVFVNEDTEEIKRQASDYQLNTVQLHGSESPENSQRIKESGLRVIKAMHLKKAEDLKQLEPYHSVVDCFLFDTPSRHHGGTGETFDWDLLKDYDSSVPFMLSGGISMDNLKQVKDVSPAPLGIDVNSRFEIGPGRKDVALVDALINTVRDDF